MTQVLFVLALSTKVMMEGRIGGFISSTRAVLADHNIEKLMKRLVGRTAVEDAFRRLSMLTLEENPMTTATTPQDTHQVHENVTETKEVVHDVTVGGDMEATRESAHWHHDHQNVLEDPYDLTDIVNAIGKGKCNDHGVEGTGPSA
jgi:hypothetical protein